MKKKNIIIVIIMLQFLYLYASCACAQKNAVINETEDSISLTQWLEKYDSTVLEKITKIKLPHSNSNSLFRINFMRQGNRIHTGCIIDFDNNGLSHVFKIEYLRGTITFLSPKLDTPLTYNQYQLNAIFDTAKSIGPKKCDRTSDQPKMFLTMNNNENAKASFYYSCYRIRRNTAFGKFIDMCLSFSYNN